MLSEGTPTRAAWGWLTAIAALSLFYRLSFPDTFLELDGSIYIRAASDYARHFSAGDWLRVPLSRESYTAIEYWPPLYPLLSGLAAAVLGLDAEAAARWVSFVSGWLLIFPTFLLAARFWGCRAGLMAAAVVGFYPILGWYGRVPRATSLYLLLQVTAVALALGAAWRPSPRAWLSAAASGLCFGLAWMTRFETPLPLALTVASMLLLGRRQGDRCALRLASIVIGMSLVCAGPYLGYLASLNGGRPTLITPEKRMFDTMEGFWTVVRGGSMRTFNQRFGLPGVVRVDPSDPVASAAFEEEARRHVPTLLLDGVRHLPRSLVYASANWLPIVVGLALLGVGVGWRDPRVQAVVLLLLQDPAIALLTSWDPNPRYYASSVPLLTWLACPAALALWDGALRVPPRLRAVVGYGLAPCLVFLAWRVPLVQHFDVRYVLDGCVATFVPDAQGTVLRMVLLGSLASLGISLYPPLRCLAGPLGGIVAAQVLAGRIDPTAFQKDAQFGYTLHVPLTLGLLAVGMAVAGVARWLQEARSRRPWEQGLLIWIAAVSLALAVQSSVAMGFIDCAYGRGLYADSVAGWLRDHPEVGRVVSPQPYDAFRTGRDWLPCKEETPADAIGDMAVDGSDALVVPSMFHNMGGRGLRFEHLADPRIEAVGTFRGRRDYCRTVWAIYKRAR